MKAIAASGAIGWGSLAAVMFIDAATAAVVGHWLQAIAYVVVAPGCIYQVLAIRRLDRESRA